MDKWWQLHPIIAPLPKGFMDDDTSHQAAKEWMDRATAEIDRLTAASKALTAKAGKLHDYANMRDVQVTRLSAEVADARKVIEKSGEDLNAIYKHIEEHSFPRALGIIMQALFRIHTFLASGEKPRYRLLDSTDTIQAGDDVIDDDGVTWIPVDRWAIGCKFTTIFKTCRRRLAASAKESSEGEAGK